jgi:Gamma-glutamyltranspeptidase
MLHSLQATRGMAVAPHSLASQSALAILRDGGNAVEAMIAAAATVAVAYPHMNSIGGDGFWTISVPGQPAVGIEAAGRAASAASRDFYQSRGLAAIPLAARWRPILWRPRFPDGTSPIPMRVISVAECRCPSCSAMPSTTAGRASQ